MKTPLRHLALLLLIPLAAQAQVNSGSNGSDGAFNPTTNIVINMADHPNGIYQYTSVNISNVVAVTFIPNANNSPVVWLVQSNCVISGQINLDAQAAGPGVGGSGGPGGYAGGNAGSVPTPGQGPGGGPAGSISSYGGTASYGSLGSGTLQGSIYGNAFLLPLIGGSGGGGGGDYYHRSLAGGGGGGAILIAAPNIQLNGGISAGGGSGSFWNDGSGGYGWGAGGSGGAVRLIANIISGTGSIAAGVPYGSGGGLGRIRFDTYQNSFGGTLAGVWTQGFQPIIIPTPGQGAQLIVTSVGGVPVSASPSGQLVTPDAVLSAQQNNPISIVVHCSNIPLNTQITVSVRPANGATVSATGLNNTGTLASSTATISITMPRGGGIIFATAAN